MFRTLVAGWLVCLLCLGIARGQRMYFTDTYSDVIWSANVDASEITLLVEGGLSSPRGIAIDATNSKMYWVDYETHRIERANLDGSDREPLATRVVSAPRGIALDPENGKAYWTDQGTRTIDRANLDGTSQQRLVTQGLSYPYTIRLDLVNDQMYWEDRETLRLERANLDGSGVTTIVNLDPFAGFLPVGFDIDWQNSHIYFADGGNTTQSIRRVNLDGSSEKIIVPGVSNVRAVTIDTQNRKLYWVEDNGVDDVIRRSSFDGRSVEDVLYAPYFAIRSLAFDYRPAVLGDFNRNTVLDVGDIQSLVDEFGDPINLDVYDVNRDNNIDVADLLVWVRDLRSTWIGDANLDGQFSSGDLVTVFQAGQYEDGTESNSTWASGDWNGDHEFTTGDLVVAFQDGGYEQGPRPLAAAVPEPSSLWLALGCTLLLTIGNRSCHQRPRSALNLEEPDNSRCGYGRK